MSVYVANVRIDPKDHNHPWPGLVPFPHFEPGDYAKDCAESLNETPSLADMAGRRDDFNQPSTWVLLHKSADAFRHTPGQLNSQGKLTFAFGASPGTLELKNGRTAVGLGGSPGMSVISRGQTYYHRPGNWTEQPNFFNPYWRPRLAAVWQGKDSLPLVGKLADALPGDLKDAPTRFITH
jgi:hypothetical protein